MLPKLSKDACCRFQDFDLVTQPPYLRSYVGAPVVLACHVSRTARPALKLHTNLHPQAPSLAVALHCEAVFDSMTCIGNIQQLTWVHVVHSHAGFMSLAHVISNSGI